MGSDPQLRHVQRQEGQYLADSQSGEEAAEPDGNEVNFPGFHKEIVFIFRRIRRQISKLRALT